METLPQSLNFDKNEGKITIVKKFVAFIHCIVITILSNGFIIRRNYNKCFGSDNVNRC